MSKVTKEEVEAFLHGSNPMERIVKIECGYDDTKAKVYYRDISVCPISTQAQKWVV